MKFGRRAFLILLAVIGGAFGILRTRHSIKVFLTGADRKADPPDNRERNGSQEQSLVSVIGGGDVKKMTRRAVALIGGFGPLEIEGKSVLVKPNVVGERANPSTTSRKWCGRWWSCCTRRERQRSTWATCRPSSGARRQRIWK